MNWTQDNGEQFQSTNNRFYIQIIPSIHLYTILLNSMNTGRTKPRHISVNWFQTNNSSPNRFYVQRIEFAVYFERYNRWMNGPRWRFLGIQAKEVWTADLKNENYSNFYYDLLKRIWATYRNFKPKCHNEKKNVQNCEPQNPMLD